MELCDKQNEPDHRRINIDKVGVKGIKFPVKVLQKDGGAQSTVAEIGLYVDLPHEYKGTHMSRFLEVLNAQGSFFHIDAVQSLLEATKKRLHAQNAHLDIRFPYFLTRKAPVSGQAALMDYEIRFKSALFDDRFDSIQTVKCGVTTLCPCSKAISRYGAHNQRGIVSISIRYKETVWFEDIIAIAESSASGALYSLLKRVDEKYVTEQAYENPVFVEDVVRNAVVKLKANPAITGYEVEAENAESIHNHNAYASVHSENWVW